MDDLNRAQVFKWTLVFICWLIATLSTLGALFLGERLESFEVIGMGLIALGLVTIDGRLFKRR